MACAPSHFPGPKVNGRPPTDLVKLAADLIEWSYLPDSLNLIGFSSPRKFSVTRLADYAAKDKDFSDALLLAKENISQNRFKAACLKIMPEVFYTRCEGLYDPLYHKYDRDQKKFDADLRKDIEGSKQSTYNIVVPHDLAIGTNIPTSTISKEVHSSSK